MATEQQPYEVIRSEPTFGVRRYPEHVTAEVTIAAPFEEAGNRAFRSLFGYISGANRSRMKVAMTAPVMQQSSGATDEYRVAFVMPSDVDAPYVPAFLRRNEPLLDLETDGLEIDGS